MQNNLPMGKIMIGMSELTYKPLQLLQNEKLVTLNQTHSIPIVSVKRMVQTKIFTERHHFLWHAHHEKTAQ